MTYQTKFSDLLSNLIPDEKLRLAIDRKHSAYMGKVIREAALNKEMLAEHIYQIVPKNNIEAEEALMARIILYPKDAFGLLNRLGAMQEGLFYDKRFALIYKCLICIYDAHHPITIESLIVEIRDAEMIEACGGEEFLRLLVVGVNRDGLEEYAGIVIACYETRLVWELCAQAISDTQKLKPSEISDYRQELVSKLSLLAELSIDTNTIVDGNVLADELLAYQMENEERAANGNEVEFPCHLNNVNDNIGGWGRSDLVIVAARPAMGKTSYILADAIHALLRGESVLIFSLEMSKLQLALRMCAIYFEIADMPNRIKKSELTNAELSKFREFTQILRTWKIHILDKPAATAKGLKSEAHLYHKKFGVNRIYVDYLQLMSHESQSVCNNQVLLTEINSAALKALAKELQIPVMALSQLSREVEKRPNKRPILSDLRHSGSIEQDADMVIFLYRAEYYKILEDEDGKSLKGVGEVIVAKNRNGSLGTYQAFFNAPCVKWDNIEALEAKNGFYSNATLDAWEAEIGVDVQHTPKGGLGE